MTTRLTVSIEADVVRRERIYWVRWPPQHQAPADREPAP